MPGVESNFAVKIVKTGTYYGVFEYGVDPLLVTETMGIEQPRAWKKWPPIPHRPE